MPWICLQHHALHTQAREEQLNSLVDHLTVQEPGKAGSGMLDPKVSLHPLSSVLPLPTRLLTSAWW